MESMEDQIRSALHHPQELETLYRSNPQVFQKTFLNLYPSLGENQLADAWYFRLHQEPTLEKNNPNPENPNVSLIETGLLTLGAFILVKLPKWFEIPIEYEDYLTKFFGFFIFPFLMIYWGRTRNIAPKHWAITAIGPLMALAILYFTPFPSEATTWLTYLHMPFFLWIWTLIPFAAKTQNAASERMQFIRYSGDLVVVVNVILFIGGLFVGLTYALFQLMLNIDLMELYLENSIIWGLVASPIIATYFIARTPNLVARLTSALAKAFTPLVLLTLLLFLYEALLRQGFILKDREGLIVFNGMLMAVLAIIIFSVSKHEKAEFKQFQGYLLIVLSIVATVVNLMALFQISERLLEYGLSANRMAVLGGNLLMLTHLIGLVISMVRTPNSAEPSKPIQTITSTLLLGYGLWAFTVVFLFPLLFK
jgi:hypothetical protein